MNPEKPGAFFSVSVVFDGNLIARGVACRFRKDLVDAGQGWGWNAFRLALLQWPAASPARPVLDLMSDAKRLWSGSVAWREDVKHQYTTVEQLINYDPTQIRDPSILRGLREHLAALHRILGDNDFICRCYIAIFGRQADLSGLSEYRMLLQSGTLQPFDIVTAMMRGAEFLARGQGVQPPTLTSFPFLLAQHESDSAQFDGVLPGPCVFRDVDLQGRKR